MKRYYTCLVLLLTWGMLLAQDMIPKRVLKLDAYALSNRSLSMALELRNAPKISWEFGLGVTQWNPQEKNPFTDKSISSSYRILQTNMTGWEQYPASSTTEYVGTGRPVSSSRLPFNVTYSVDMRLGCTASFLSKNAKWRLLLMPSLQSSYVRYRNQSTEGVKVEKTQHTAWIETIPNSSDPNAIRRVTQTLTDYRQVQTSTTGGRMLGGVAYEMGVSRYFGKKMLAEVRYRIGQNFAGLDGKENLPSALQRGFSTFTLHVGYILDKPAVKEEAKVNVKPTKNIKKKDAKKKKKSKKKKRRRH